MEYQFCYFTSTFRNFWLGGSTSSSQNPFLQKYFLSKMNCQDPRPSVTRKNSSRLVLLLLRQLRRYSTHFLLNVKSVKIYSLFRPKSINGLPLFNEVIVFIVGMTWQFGDNWHNWTFSKSVMWIQLFKFPKCCCSSVNRDVLSNCITLFVLIISICATMIIANDIRQFFFYILVFHYLLE